LSCVKYVTLPIRVTCLITLEGAKSTQGNTNFNSRRSQVRRMGKISLNAGCSFFSVFTPQKHSLRKHSQFLFVPLPLSRKALFIGRKILEGHSPPHVTPMTLPPGWHPWSAEKNVGGDFVHLLCIYSSACKVRFIS